LRNCHLVVAGSKQRDAARDAIAAPEAQESGAGNDPAPRLSPLDPAGCALVVGRVLVSGPSTELNSTSVKFYRQIIETEQRQ
jgi:hypothetical protein